MKNMLALYVKHDQVFFSLVHQGDEEIIEKISIYQINQIDDLFSVSSRLKNENTNLDNSLYVLIESTKTLVHETNLPKMSNYRAKKIIGKELKDLVPKVDKYTIYNHFHKTSKGYLNIKSVLVEDVIIKNFKTIAAKLKMDIKFFFTYDIQKQAFLDSSNGVILKHIHDNFYLSMTYNNLTREFSLDNISNISLTRAIDSLFASFMLGQEEVEKLTFIFVTCGNESLVDVENNYLWTSVTCDEYLKASLKHMSFKKGVKL